MLKISEKYIVDSKNKKIAVQIPFETYKKIETALGSKKREAKRLNT